MESPKDNSTAATGFVAKSGIFQSICGFSVTTKGSDWIIDTGATNHMTCDRNMFTQFSSNSSVPVIINANGASSPVMGSGTIYISPLLSISNVLFVPSLNCNILFVSQLTKSHNCVLLFFPTYCILQNIHTKEKMGEVKDYTILRVILNIPKEYARSRHQRLYEENVGKTGKDVVYEL